MTLFMNCLLFVIIFTSLNFELVSGRPWKQYIKRNIPAAQKPVVDVDEKRQVVLTRVKREEPAETGIQTWIEKEINNIKQSAETLLKKSEEVFSSDEKSIENINGKEIRIENIEQEIENEIELDILEKEEELMNFKDGDDDDDDNDDDDDDDDDDGDDDDDDDDDDEDDNHSKEEAEDEDEDINEDKIDETDDDDNADDADDEVVVDDDDDDVGDDIDDDDDDDDDGEEEEATADFVGYEEASIEAANDEHLMIDPLSDSTVDEEENEEISQTFWDYMMNMFGMDPEWQEELQAQAEEDNMFDDEGDYYVGDYDIDGRGYLPDSLTADNLIDKQGKMTVEIFNTKDKPTRLKRSA